MESKTLTYDLDRSDPAPEKGQYLIGIGKRGIGQILLRKAVRAVNHRTVTDYQRYVLTVEPRPELRPYIEYERTQYSANVWVRGVEALPFFWHPRGKK